MKLHSASWGQKVHREPSSYSLSYVYSSSVNTVQVNLTISKARLSWKNNGPSYYITVCCAILLPSNVCQNLILFEIQAKKWTEMLYSVGRFLYQAVSCKISPLQTSNLSVSVSCVQVTVYIWWETADAHLRASLSDSLTVSCLTSTETNSTSSGLRNSGRMKSK